ncbi:MAG TPA: hypothetical protein VIO57_12345 [Chloroflexota bacterium]
MSTAIERFAFVDSVHAAEFLHVTQDAVLDMIAGGRLNTFGGKPSNPFLRSSDVAALAKELGVSAEEAPKRMKSPTARVQTRLTADARWADIGEADLSDWVARADDARRSGARAAAQVARQRLERLIQLLDERQALDQPTK